MRFRPKTLKQAYLWIIVPVITLISFGVFFAFQISDLKDGHMALFNRLQHSLEAYNTLLSAPLWGAENGRVAEVCHALLSDPAITGVAVFDEDKLLVANVGSFRGLKQSRSAFG